MVAGEIEPLGVELKILDRKDMCHLLGPAFFSRCLLPEEERGRSEAKSSVDTGS